MNTVLLGLVPFVYLGAFVLALAGIIAGKKRLSSLALMIASPGFFLHTLGLVLRWVESYRLGFGHAPLSNFYESLIVFSWAIVLGCLLLDFRKRSGMAAPFALPAAFLLMAYASYSPDVESRIQPLVPALQSNWLAIHVITCFLGYGAFFLAAVFGMLYLLAGDGQARWKGVPGREYLMDRLYRNVSAGYVLFTLGIVTGSVWAQSAWGSWWSWDPKETWALITWMIYTALIHDGLPARRRGKRTAVLSLAGLAGVLFTYLGVNGLPGLHSYF